MHCVEDLGQFWSVMKAINEMERSKITQKGICSITLRVMTDRPTSINVCEL